MTETTEKTDEELIHKVEDALGDVEAIVSGFHDPILTAAVERLHRRLNRCLNRYNRDHAGDNQVALRSGGGKTDDPPPPPAG